MSEGLANRFTQQKGESGKLGKGDITNGETPHFISSKDSRPGHSKRHREVAPVPNRCLLTEEDPEKD